MKRNMRWRILIALLSVLVAVSMALAGCGGRDEQEPDPEPEPEPTKQVETIREFLSGTDYDDLDTGIDEGTDMPVSLHFFSTDEYDDEITDGDKISEFWNMLSNLEIRTDDTYDDLAIEDGQFYYEFKWADGRTYEFSFNTSEYYESYSDEDGHVYYQTADPSEVGRVMNEMTSYLRNRDDAGTVTGEQKIEVKDDAFEWDGNGDGKAEKYSIEKIDNGDEAPNVIKIKSDAGQEATIDRAYDIKNIVSGEDEYGRYVNIRYTFGDYEQHDDLRDAKLRIRNGELTCELIGH